MTPSRRRPLSLAPSLPAQPARDCSRGNRPGAAWTGIFLEIALPLCLLSSSAPHPTDCASLQLGRPQWLHSAGHSSPEWSGNVFGPALTPHIWPSAASASNSLHGPQPSPPSPSMCCSSGSPFLLRQGQGPALCPSVPLLPVDTARGLRHLSASSQGTLTCSGAGPEWSWPGAAWPAECGLGPAVPAGANIASGEEVAIKLECVKTKHPQLHIESKFYKMMQGGGEARGAVGVGVGALRLCLGHSNGEGPRDWWAGECRCLTAPPPCSGDPIHQVVRCRGGLQRDGHGAAGAQPRGPLQLLLPQVQPQDCAAPGRPDGESPHLLPQARGHWVPSWRMLEQEAVIATWDRDQGTLTISHGWGRRY